MKGTIVDRSLMLWGSDRASLTLTLQRFALVHKFQLPHNILSLDLVRANLDFV